MMQWLLVLVVALMPPELKVNWTNNKRFDTVKITVQGRDVLSSDCLASGLELRYRYELRFCKRKAFWADSCEDEKRELHSLQYDPISQTYRLTSDRLEDTVSPRTDNVSSEADAFRFLSQIDALPLSFLKDNFNAERDRKGSYLEVRLLTQCRGDYNRTLERISYFLSLGMVRTRGFDSGWISFPLDTDGR